MVAIELPEKLKIEHSEPEKKGGGPEPFAYGGPAGRSEFFDLPEAAPQSVNGHRLSARLRDLVQQKIQLIDQINKFYGREDGRFRRATDLVKAGGADAGKSRDGLSSLSAVIAEHGLYSQQTNNFIQGALGDIDRRIEAEKEAEYRRSNRVARIGRGMAITAGILLLGAFLAPALGLLPFSVPFLTGITGAISAVFHIPFLGGLLGGITALVGVAGVVMERGIAPRTRPGFDLSAVGYPASRTANYVEPETPNQAQTRMIEGVRALAGVAPGGGPVNLSNQIVNLNNVDNLKAVSEGLMKQANDANYALPRTHRTTQAKGI